MKINKDYKLRSIAGENLVVKVTEAQSDMTKVIALNDSSAWLWGQLADRDFTTEDAVSLLTQHYDVDAKTAGNDVTHWIETLAQHSVIL